jgi:uncharacterized DUF497 family protein
MFDDVVYRDRFIWHRNKNELNKQKHRISFETASQIFDDPFIYEVYDVVNSITEDRYKSIGSVIGILDNSLLTVSIVYRGNFIRILSARSAEPLEKGAYYEHFRDYAGEEDED